MYLAGYPMILISLLSGNRRIAFSRIPQLCIYSLKSLFSFFFGMIEMAFYGRRINKTVINEVPIFVLGHYRTGTTLLQKLLCCDDNYGTIQYKDVFTPVPAFLFPGMTAWIQQLIARIFKVRNIFFNNMSLRIHDPGEEDLYMISGCSRCTTAWGFLFPKAIIKYFTKWTTFENDKEKKQWIRAYGYHLKRITLKNDNKPLILKSPPNIGRIRVLLELFPNARFIFITRNPYQVYYSMQRLWSSVIERYFSLQKISAEEKSDIVFDLYSSLMNQYLEDRELIPQGNHIEIRFEDLEKKPIEEIRKIYEALNIPGFEDSIDRIKQRLELENGYLKNVYDYDEKTLDLISEKWGDFIHEWNYMRPVVTSSI
jgi:hypothetical protein